MGESAKLGRAVALPWAPYEAPVSAAVRDDGRDSFRVAPPRLSKEAHGFEAPDASWAHVRHALAPELRAAGLPYSPWPTLPEADRMDVDPESIISLAVALDVLGSALDRLEDTSAVLADLTETLLGVGRSGGLDEATIAGLVAYAGGDAGRARSALNRHLSRMAGDAGDVIIGDGTSPHSTPESVGEALRRVSEAARIVVREATLVLQAREGVEYRQA